MSVGPLKKFEKELRVKIYEELEKEREKLALFNSYLYSLVIELFQKIMNNYDSILSESDIDLEDEGVRLKQLIYLYKETSNLHVKVKDVNEQVQRIKELQNQ